MCDPSDSIKYLKDQVSLATKNELQSDHMRLILPKDSMVLNDDDTLETQEDIQNESELYLVLQVADNEWEPVEVAEDPAVADGS